MDNEMKQQVNGEDLLEVKKIQSVDINRRKTTWILIGFVMVLSLVFVVFEYTSREEEKLVISEDVIIESLMEYIPPSKPLEPQPKPQVKTQKVTEKIEVIENEEITEEEVVLTVEDNEIVEVQENVVHEVVEEVVEEQIFNVVETMPEFPGGMKALAKYLKDNLQYPRSSRERGSQGKVMVAFVVETDGSITDINVIRGAGDPLLDKEALRVVEAMPKWKPGHQSGQAVRVRFTVPVTFRLQ